MRPHVVPVAKPTHVEPQRSAKVVALESRRQARLEAQRPIRQPPRTAA
jgi:hypothetical protein